MHLSDDLLIVEPVDELGDPVPAGVRSNKIYLTNLFNPLMPLIRYEITDEITLDDEPCACGSIHRRIHDIQGRNDDTFHYQPGVASTPTFSAQSSARNPSISEYQIRQTPTGVQITICATGPVDRDASPARSLARWRDPDYRAAGRSPNRRGHPTPGDRQAEALHPPRLTAHVERE